MFILLSIKDIKNIFLLLLAVSAIGLVIRGFYIYIVEPVEHFAQEVWIGLPIKDTVVMETWIDGKNFAYKGKPIKPLSPEWDTAKPHRHKEKYTAFSTKSIKIFIADVYTKSQDGITIRISGLKIDYKATGDAFGNLPSPSSRDRECHPGIKKHYGYLGGCLMAMRGLGDIEQEARKVIDNIYSGFSVKSFIDKEAEYGADRQTRDLMLSQELGIIFHEKISRFQPLSMDAKSFAAVMKK